MPSTLPDSRPSTRLNSLDAIELKPAKASLAVNDDQRQMTAVVRDALQVHYGKLDVAAREMGGMDPGQLTRELQTGKFKFERLQLLDDAGKAAVANALQAAFGRPADPRTIVRHELREIRQRIDRVEALIAS